MKAENTVFDYSTKRNVVEHVGEHFPDILTSVLSQALVVKPVSLRKSPRLVVASGQSDSVLIPNFQRYEEADSLNRVVSPIHIISEKEIVSVGYISPDREELYKVMELTVDVSTDGDWCSNGLYVRFGGEYLYGLGGEELDFGLGDPLEAFKFLYDVVDVVVLHLNITEVLSSANEVLRWSDN